MIEFDENKIAEEAYRLWRKDGSPLWSHPNDHWFRAIDNLRSRAADPQDGTAPDGEPALSEKAGAGR